MSLLGLTGPGNSNTNSYGQKNHFARFRFAPLLGFISTDIQMA
jgi:hypothetical protein